MDTKLLKNGAFSWFELMTTDVAGAKDFYAKLFGWEMEKAPMEGIDYTVINVGGEGVGGIMELPAEFQGMPPAWGIYVTVDDVDKTAERVTELGGKILLPASDIPDVGRFCVLQDPQGGVITAISYAPME